MTLYYILHARTHTLTHLYFGNIHMRVRVNVLYAEAVRDSIIIRVAPLCTRTMHDDDDVVYVYALHAQRTV